MLMKPSTIPFNSLKMSTRVVTYILFGIIILTAAINIFGIMMSGDSVLYRITEAICQLIYPGLCYLVRTLILVKNKLKQPGVIRIAGTMMPLFIFAIGFVMCFNTGLAVFTLTPGYGYPRGSNSIFLCAFIPFLILAIDRFVFADPENLCVGTRFIPANKIMRIEIYNENYRHKVKVDSEDGSKLAFGLSYKVEKERLMKFIEDHGINSTDK